MVYYSISAIIEIAFFIGIGHLIIQWLAQDKRCNLVGYFILYITTLVMTEQCGLVTMHYFLYWMAPCFGTLFVLLHQQQLQKNFVTITHTTQQNKTLNNHDLISTLLQIGLHNSTQKRNTLFIIEGNQDLSLLLHATVPLNIAIQKELVTSVCDSLLYDQNSAIWIQYTGIIKGINSSLNRIVHTQNEEEILRNALDSLCKKTDCFIVFCDANGLWTFKNNTHTYKALSTVQIQKLCIQKIELLVQQRSFTYVSSQTTNNQTTVS